MTNCLNCYKTIPTEASFCANCGAKVVKQRITLKSILSEVAETIFGWDNKYFFTVKSLVLKPQIALEEYVSGVRKRYVHPFTFLLIGATIVLFSFTFFLDDFMGRLEEFNLELVEQYKDFGVKNLDLERTDQIQGDIIKYFNIVTLLLIPLYALLTFVIYRKTYNYAEHLVFNAYVQGVGFIFVFVFFYLSLMTHPLVYGLTTLATWTVHAFAFGKLHQLGAAMSILKLVFFNLMFFASIVLLLALMVLISIVIAHIKA